MLHPNLDYGDNLIASQEQIWKKAVSFSISSAQSPEARLSCTDLDIAPCCYLILYRKKEFSFKISDIGCKLVQAECG